MGWLFGTTKTLQETGFLEGMTDWHSHILPGVDDGVKRIEESLEILSTMEKNGVRKIWLTPHIMEDYPNTTEELRQGFAELQKAWRGNVELRLASENMLDNIFEERLSRGDLLPIGDDGTHLLVETSYYTPPYGMDDMIEGIFSKGYFPVLAHPERYRYMEEQDYRRLRERGVKFQMNYLSLVGGYGETARKKAEWLMTKGMIDVAGSDVHRLGALLSGLEGKLKGKNIIENIMRLQSGLL